eukprot:Rhum_TRINITY_DN13622_c0_g4::Rhum_TRINITY_DN13622_c0_g4_i1::g.62086::m.62086/K01074/PPT; palmitoyl-protein thioesterase
MTMATWAVLLATAAGASAAKTLPTVLGHGMSDTCFSKEYEGYTQVVAEATGTYAACIPTGPDAIIDRERSFFMSMDRNIDIFAEKIRADPKLAGGFNAIGFSQGNSLIRGYIHKYNNPPVHTFVSVHGTVMGVSGFPECHPSTPFIGPICKDIDRLLGDLAYYKTTQDVLFQAGYYRDPMRRTTADYKANSEIAQYNNEGNTFNQTYKDNFVTLKRLVMIKALKDDVVIPREGEWWGSYAEGSFKTLLNMTETDVYKKDTFGLRTVHEAGKMIFNTTDRGHVEFSNAQLAWWTANYFLE